MKIRKFIYHRPNVIENDVQKEIVSLTEKDTRACQSRYKIYLGIFTKIQTYREKNEDIDPQAHPEVEIER